MSTYQKAGDDVRELADKILKKHESHKPLVEAKVRIDFLLAFPEEDAEGNPTGPALMCKGWPAHAVCRKVNLKDRVKGMGDAEITIDGEWWDDESRTEQQREALLDHELHHLEIVKDDEDVVQKDTANRPKLRLRKHDVEVGWFKVVAERNAEHSMERRQASALLTDYGQYFWPSIIPLQEKAPAIEKKKAA